MKNFLKNSICLCVLMVAFCYQVANAQRVVVNKVEKDGNTTTVEYADGSNKTYNLMKSSKVSHASKIAYLQGTETSWKPTIMTAEGLAFNRWTLTIGGGGIYNWDDGAIAPLATLGVGYEWRHFGVLVDGFYTRRQYPHTAKADGAYNAFGIMLKVGYLFRLDSRERNTLGIYGGGGYCHARSDQHVGNDINVMSKNYGLAAEGEIRGTFSISQNGKHFLFASASYVYMPQIEHREKFSGQESRASGNISVKIGYTFKF